MIERVHKWAVACQQVQREYPELSAEIAVSGERVHVRVHRWHNGHYASATKYTDIAQIVNADVDPALKLLAEACAELVIFGQGPRTKPRLVIDNGSCSTARR